MAIKQDWNNSHLEDYLLYGNWRPYQAWSVLAGFDYHANLELGEFSFDENQVLDVFAFFPFDTDVRDVEIEIKKMNNNVDRLRNFWISDGNYDEAYSPSYFIEWALSKRFRPEWLDWAIEKKLYMPKDESTNQSENSDKQLSKRTENNYLRLIMQLANNISGFNPQNPYEAAALIIDNTDTDLDRKTIANYIQKAYELLSKERD